MYVSMNVCIHVYVWIYVKWKLNFIEKVHLDSWVSIQAHFHTHNIEFWFQTMSTELMFKLKMELKNLFAFVFEASTPWAHRAGRSQEAHCLLQKQIQKIVYSSAQLSDKEQKFNILFDSIRQASTKEQLHKTLEDTIGCLNDILSR